MRRPTLRRALAAVQLALVLAACEHIIVPHPDRVELHRSATQELVFQNSGAQPLAIEPLESDGQPLEIAPAGQTTIDVVIATVAELEQSPDQPWLVPVPGTEANSAIELQPEGYLQPVASDLVLRVRGGAEPGEERRLSLLCAPVGWEAAPAPSGAHRVDLAQAPLPGVPVPICPPAEP